jgi:hypothetical protein
VKHAAVLLACVLTLAACNRDVKVDARNASAEDVARQVADARGSDNFVRPGKWKSTVHIENFELPGAPAEAKTAMSNMQHQAMVSESCLTPEEAKRPKEGFFAGKDKNCRYDHFTMSNGKIDAAMKCTGQGMAQTMAMQGSYSPDAYQMRMSMKADAGAGPAGGMTMTMRVDAERVGECDAKKG